MKRNTALFVTVGRHYIGNQIRKGGFVQSIYYGVGMKRTCKIYRQNLSYINDLKGMDEI